MSAGATPEERLAALGLTLPAVARALQHRDAGVARIRWILTGATAQREAGAARVPDDLLMGAAVAEPGADAGGGLRGLRI